MRVATAAPYMSAGVPGGTHAAALFAFRGITAPEGTQDASPTVSDLAVASFFPSHILVESSEIEFWGLPNVEIGAQIPTIHSWQTAAGETLWQPIAGLSTERSSTLVKSTFPNLVRGAHGRGVFVVKMVDAPSPSPPPPPPPPPPMPPPPPPPPPTPPPPAPEVTIIWAEKPPFWKEAQTWYWLGPVAAAALPILAVAVYYACRKPRRLRPRKFVDDGELTDIESDDEENSFMGRKANLVYPYYSTSQKA